MDTQRVRDEARNVIYQIHKTERQDKRHIKLKIRGKSRDTIDKTQGKDKR